MTTFVALLRSINVGGRNRVLMGDLAGLVESLGFDDVETYVQSGNVVFTGSGDSDHRRPGPSREAIARELGLEVPVIVGAAGSCPRLLEVNPFLRSGADPQAPARDVPGRSARSRSPPAAGPVGEAVRRGPPPR